MSERELGVYLGHIVMAMDAIAEYIVGMRERISLTTARPKMPLSAIAKLSGRQSSTFQMIIAFGIPKWIGEALPGFATCSFTSIMALTMWLSGRSQSRNVRFIGQP